MKMFTKIPDNYTEMEVIILNKLIQIFYGSKWCLILFSQKVEYQPKM